MGIPIHNRAGDTPRQRPADDPPSGHPPRSQRHGRRSAADRLERRQQPGDVVGVVAEVGVHVEGDREPVGARRAKAFDDRRAEAAATAAHEHVEARPRPREVEDERSRAVGGVVIYDEHLQPGIDPEDTIDKRSDRPAFVVGRRHDEHAPRWPSQHGGQIPTRLRRRVCPSDPSGQHAAHSADPPRRIRANRRR